MLSPIVIVDPLSSGVDLAKAFKAKGIPLIAVELEHPTRLGFGTEIDTTDFFKVLKEDDKLIDELRLLKPYAILPGTELGVDLAEKLSLKLTPQFSNKSELSLQRRHKAYMQDALEKAGLSVIKTLNTSSESEVENWILKNHLQNSPLIIKPPNSAGSENVFHIPKHGNWKTAFKRILSDISGVTG